MMMDLLRPWLLGIIAAALILAMLYALVPSGKLRGALRLTGGMVLLLLLLQPVSGWDLPRIGSDAASIRQEIDRQIQSYRETNMQQLDAIIAEQTAAYISDKGKQWGLICRPTVELRRQENVSVPYRVILDIPYHRALSEYISDELGIAPDRQVWQEDTP